MRSNPPVGFWGKAPVRFSRLFEYHPGLVRQVIADYFGIPYQTSAPPDPAALLGSPLPERPPNLCPGCSHRATYYTVKIALRDLGVGRDLSHRHRLLHPGTAAAAERGRLSVVHGVQRQHQQQASPGPPARRSLDLSATPPFFTRAWPAW